MIVLGEGDGCPYCNEQERSARFRSAIDKRQKSSSLAEYVALLGTVVMNESPRVEENVPVVEIFSGGVLWL